MAQVLELRPNDKGGEDCPFPTVLPGKSEAPQGLTIFNSGCRVLDGAMPAASANAEAKQELILIAFLGLPQLIERQTH